MVTAVGNVRPALAFHTMRRGWSQAANETGGNWGLGFGGGEPAKAAIAKKKLIFKKKKTENNTKNAKNGGHFWTPCG